MLRVLQLGLGPLGRMIVEQLHRSGVGMVAGAVDPDPAVRGRRLSELTNEYGPVDPTVAGSIEELEARATFDAAIVSTSSSLEACGPTFEGLLSRGLAVVSTCEELLFPWLGHKDLAERLDALARKSGGRLLGTGVNPGFLMDTLPVAATAVCSNVRGALIERVQDATTRRVPFQRKIGAGLTQSEFSKKIADQSLRHVGLGESLHFVAHYLGLSIDAWSESIEPVLADRPVAWSMGTIPAGNALGVHQSAQGMRAGKPVIRLEFIAAIGQPDPHDRIRIEAEPPIDLLLRGGVHGDLATVNIVVNALPSLIDAAPGLHTMATIRPVHATAPIPGVSGDRPGTHILS